MAMLRRGIVGLLALLVIVLSTTAVLSAQSSLFEDDLRAWQMYSTLTSLAGLQSFVVPT